MIGKRERLARLLDAVGFNAVVTAVRARTPAHWLSVLTYHRVGTPSDAVAGDMYDASPAQFDEQLAHLSRHFNFVTTEDVVAMLDGESLPPNPVMVTFDDGYIDNLETVMPMLLRHRAKATFFIATDYVDDRRMFWWDRITQLVTRAKAETFELTYPRRLTFRRRDAVHKLTDLVKTEYGLDLERFLEHLREQLEVDWSLEREREQVDEVLMTWDQIREIVAAGMDVQSHTRSHRVIQTLPPERLDDELRGSRETLEERIGKPVRALAYPVGYPIQGDQRLRDAVSAAGYRAAFSNQTGPISTWQNLDPFDLNRMAAYPEASGALFRAMMAVPLLSPSQREPPPPVH